jgi:hypothetical protein
LQEFGAYDFGARIFMADIARWFAVDPMAEANPGLSVYRYGFNNPIMFTDPNGMLEQALTNRMLELGGNWKNEGNGFESNEHIKLGYNGNYLSLNTNIDDNFDPIINLPGVTLSGYGSANHWGGAISTYNINHGILYNGIDGMRAAWNYYNRPMDPMAWVRSDGPVQMMSGDMFGFSDLIGIGLNRVSEDHPYAAMALGIMAIVATKGKATDDVLKVELAAEKNLALGLSEDLFTFANTKNFDTYKTFSTGLQQDKILEAMHSYDKIHFNVTGFSKYQFSRFKPSGFVTGKNVTNWEMHEVFSNPTLLNKTQFYRKVGNDYEVLSNFSPFAY